MNEGKAETITGEDESQSEDDNSEELYQPVFMRTEETCPFARSHFLLTKAIPLFLSFIVDCIF